VAKLRTPIKWFGGKGRMKKKILPLMPECKRYVEPFGGGASILLAREPVELEVYNDLNFALYDFFTVLADPKLYKKFLRRVEALPASRKMYYEYLRTWEAEKDRIVRVAKWYYIARFSFSGHFGASFSTAVTHNCRGMASTVSKWLSILDMLPEIHARLQRVQIENQTWQTILKRYDTPDTLFYLDPPYVATTRRNGGYEHEMTNEDHQELVDAILKLEGKVVLSGYDSPLYSALDSCCERHDFDVACYAAGRTKASGLKGKGVCDKNQRRTECVWIKGVGA